MTTTWRKLIEEERNYNGDTSDLETYVPHEALDVEFHAGFGTSQGPHFLAWTTDFVYFPVVYDGAESAGSAPRNPRATGQGHVGGE